MIRRPPRSTLFPTRRSSDLLQPLPPARADPPLQRRVPHTVQTGRQGQPVTECDLRTAAGERELAERSEEHTSELQSQSNLVCRLLLEKKKQYRRHRSSCSSY